MLKGNRLFDTELLIARHKHRFIDELNTVSECRRHEVTVFASERTLSDINWCLQSRILFPVSSLKDEENVITKSAAGNNKSKYIFFEMGGGERSQAVWKVN